MRSLRSKTKRSSLSTYISRCYPLRGGGLKYINLWYNYVHCNLQLKTQWR